MFFTLQQMRQNREDERRWEERFDQLLKDMQAERERRHAMQDEQQQQLITLLAQNQQLMTMLVELLEQSNDPAAPSA